MIPVSYQPRPAARPSTSESSGTIDSAAPWHQVSLLRRDRLHQYSRARARRTRRRRRRGRHRRSANSRARPLGPALGIAAFRQSLLFDHSPSQTAAGARAADYFDGGCRPGRDPRSVHAQAPIIKWPNDILVEGKKLAGILTEAACSADRIEFVILGIGINLNYRVDSMPEEIRARATSIAD